VTTVGVYLIQETDLCIAEYILVGDIHPLWMAASEI